jgi:hypothetical protein
MKVPDFIRDLFTSYVAPQVIKAIEKGYTPAELHADMADLCEPLGEAVSKGLNKAVGNGQVFEDPLQMYLDAALDGAQVGFHRGADKDDKAR